MLRSLTHQLRSTRLGVSSPFSFISKAYLSSVHDLPITCVKTAEEADTFLKQMRQAQEQFAQYTQAEVDHIFERVSKAIRANCYELAKYAVEESGIGLVEDKVLKNIYATEYCYVKNKSVRTAGVIEEDLINGVYKVAEPVGPICALAPCTNPTATVIIKTLCALKTRNTIMFLPHPRTKLACIYAANLLEKYAVEAGAPPNTIGIAMPSTEMSKHIMTHKDTRFILATGGPAMVEACYSVGKPAIGVGPGNAPVLIDDDYCLREAVNSVIIGKTFDWGTICASEQSVIISKHRYNQLKDTLKKRGVYICSEEEKKKLAPVFMPNGTSVNPDIVGKSPQYIGSLAKLDIPDNAVAIAVEANEVGDHEVFSHEKLSPILALYQCEDFEDGVDIARQLAEHGGLGHTSVIYSKDQDKISYYKDKLPTYHVVVNMPSSLGVIGIKYNIGVDPTLTVGVGSKGGSIASVNVGPTQLIQVKVINEKRTMAEVFRTPEIFSNEYCLRTALENVVAETSAKRALVICREDQEAQNIIKELKELGILTERFSQFVAHPTPLCIRHGVDMIRDFEPDILIAVGNKQTQDLAKLMRLKYENAKISLGDLAAPFLESRWRNVNMETKKSICLVSVPDLFSCGAEMTPFAEYQVTDPKGKKPSQNVVIVLDALQPDIVVQDSQFILRYAHKKVPAMTFYSLLRGIESFVSVNSTDRTRLIAKQAMKDLYDTLKEDTSAGSVHPEVHTDISKTIGDIGIAMANSYLGIATAMSLAFSARFGIEEEVALALFMPHVIRYNSTMPHTRTMPSPNVPYIMTKEDYAEIGKNLGFSGSTDEEVIEGFIDGITELKQSLRLPICVQSLNQISEAEYHEAIPSLAEATFGNQLSSGNPRMPLLGELEQLFEKAWKE